MPTASGILGIGGAAFIFLTCLAHSRFSILHRGWSEIGAYGVDICFQRMVAPTPGSESGYEVPGVNFDWMTVISDCRSTGFAQ